MSGKIDFLEKTSESYNSYYNLYKAGWCRLTGLPMYSKKEFPLIEAARLYTVSRAKREKVQIDTSVVRGWYRMANGYTPLFKAIAKEGKE